MTQHKVYPTRHNIISSSHRGERGETLHLSRHSLWLENETADDTSNQYNTSNPDNNNNRVDVVVRALAFHQCVPRVRFPDPLSYVDWVCWFSTLFCLVFLRVLRFSPLTEKPRFEFVLLRLNLIWARPHKLMSFKHYRVKIDVIIINWLNKGYYYYYCYYYKKPQVTRTSNNRDLEELQEYNQRGKCCC